MSALSTSVSDSLASLDAATLVGKFTVSASVVTTVANDGAQHLVTTTSNSVFPAGTYLVRLSALPSCTANTAILCIQVGFQGTGVSLPSWTTTSFTGSTAEVTSPQLPSATPLVNLVANGSPLQSIAFDRSYIVDNPVTGANLVTQYLYKGNAGNSMTIVYSWTAIQLQ